MGLVAPSFVELCSAMQIKTPNKNNIALEQNSAGPAPVNAAQNQIQKETNPTIDQTELKEQIHQDKAPTQNTTSNNKDESTQKGILKIIRDRYPNWCNSIAALLHSLAPALPYLPFVPEKFSKMVDKAAVIFSKSVVPIAMLHNSWEAFVGKRGIESIIKLVTPALLYTVPLHNFNIPYGLHSSVKLILDKAMHKAPQRKEQSFGQNFKDMTQGAKNLFGDFFAGKGDWDLNSTVFAFANMLFGSVGGYLFARTERDSWPAKIFGLIRNIGGLVGDVNISIVGDEHEKKAGRLMGLASIFGIIQRWIPDPKVARIFSHALIACDDIGFNIWSNDSKRRNDKVEEQKQETLKQESEQKLKEEIKQRLTLHSTDEVMQAAA